MRLEVDVVGASVEVDLVARLLSALQNAVGHSNRQPACAARADAGHRYVPEVARNPSWVDPGKVEVGSACCVATVGVAPVFSRKCA